MKAKTRMPSQETLIWMMSKIEWGDLSPSLDDDDRKSAVDLLNTLMELSKKKEGATNE